MAAPSPAPAGRGGERLAERHLAARGLVMLGRNVRCKAGELDLVCLDGEVLVIVEVRWRSGRRFGGAAASVRAAKQRRIVRAARYLLMREPCHRSRRLRFDVVCLQGDPPRIEWIRDAFRTGDGAT